MILKLLLLYRHYVSIVEICGVLFSLKGPLKMCVHPFLQKYFSDTCGIEAYVCSQARGMSGMINHCYEFYYGACVQIC